MSLHAVVWAFDQDISPSSKKFVLLALANYSSENGKCYPSVQTICNLTSQGDETVRKALAELVQDGVITDTGKRVGATQQVKVYQLPKEALGRPLKEGVFQRSWKDPAKTLVRPLKEGGITSNLEPVTLPNGRGRQIMKRPTVEEVKLQGSKIGLPIVECEKFFDHFESNGWLVGRARTPMRKWQSALNNWKRNWQQYSKERSNHSAGRNEVEEELSGTVL